MAEGTDLANHNTKGNAENWEIVDNPGRVTSAVWKHFGFYKNKNKEGIPFIDKEQAICKICHHGCRYTSNTTNLSDHLKRKHADKIGTDKFKAKSEQTNIKQHFGVVQPFPRNSPKALAITKAIAYYIIDDYLPLSTMESKPFRELLKTIEQRYQPMSRKYLGETLLPKMYNELSEMLKAELRKTTDVALTHDMWTSINQEAFGTMTAHYVTEEWELRSVVLQTRKTDEQHTGENIASDLKLALAEWNLDHVVPYIITDNARNESKAISILKWNHFSCLGHNINLAVRAALDLPRVKTVVARGRNQVTFYHNSPLATTTLFKKQEEMLPESARKHKLIQDVVTRWNSTFDMIERLLEQTAALHAAAYDPVLKRSADKLKRNLFDHSEQSIAEQLVKILKPLKDATELLSQDEKPTMPAILPTLIKINRVLEEQDDDLLVIKDMKKKMIKNLGTRNQGELAMKTMRLASILDPRFKELRFLSPDDKTLIKDLLVAEAIKKEAESENDTGSVAATEEVAIKKEPGSSPVAKKIKEEPSSFDWLEDVVYVKTEEPKEAIALSPEYIKVEVDRYLSEPSAALKDNPLMWWKFREPSYPTLAKLARKYLAIPASSTPSERVFSSAGLIVSKRRSRISSDKVDMLIFLNKNRKMLKNFDMPKCE